MKKEGRIKVGRNGEGANELTQTALLSEKSKNLNIQTDQRWGNPGLILLIN